MNQQEGKVSPSGNNNNSSFRNEDGSFNIEKIEETLKEDGVVALSNVYSKEVVEKFQAEYTRLWSFLQEKMNELPISERTYQSGFQKKFQTLQVQYFERTEILKLAEGRYDFSYGMYDNIFGSEEFYNPEPIRSLMPKLLIREFDYIAGGLPSEGMAEVGHWHRDIYSLFDDEQIDISLPDWYFTLLIPLVPVNAVNGATEFILKSHKYKYEETEQLPRYQPDANPGDLLLFNGKVFHRGRENSSADPRPVLYIVYKKRWFCDY